MALNPDGAGNYTVLTATANVSANPCTCISIICATTSGGTVILYDSATTTTTDPITGTITLTAGQVYPIKCTTSSGLYVVIGSTATITVVWTQS